MRDKITATTIRIVPRVSFQNFFTKLSHPFLAYIFFSCLFLIYIPLLLWTALVSFCLLGDEQKYPDVITVKSVLSHPATIPDFRGESNNDTLSL